MVPYIDIRKHHHVPSGIDGHTWYKAQRAALYTGCQLPADYPAGKGDAMEKDVVKELETQLYWLKDCTDALGREVKKLKEEHPELDNDQFIKRDGVVMALEGDISVLDEIHWALKIVGNEIEGIIANDNQLEK